MTTRRGFIGGAAALAAWPGGADAAAPPRPAGRTGYILTDALTGETLASEAADDAFIPASVTKSATALVTLSTLAPTTRFVTRVHGTGALEGGTLQGDLILIGGGDSALDTSDLARLAKALRTKGVRRVAGAFLFAGVEGPRTDVLNPTQPLQANYNPAIGPLCLNYNRVLLRWRNGGREVSAIAHADDRSIPARGVVARAVRGESGPRHSLLGQREVWTLPSQDLAKNGERWFPVRRPALYAASVFRDLCTAEGVAMPEARETDTLPTDAPLALHRSDVVFAQIKKMMRYSNNLSAEMLGIAAAQRIGGTPRTVADAASTTAGWLRDQGILRGEAMLANHSGLSSASRLSPRQMVAILRAGHERYGSGFVGLHTLGTLRGDEAGLPAYTLSTKTGTMHFVRCLAGFVEVEGRLAAFAIFNGEDQRRAALDARYAPYDERRPPGARPWLRQALAHENALLRGWVSRRLR